MGGKQFANLKENLAEAAALLQHRGPDDSGIFLDEKAGVGLAHRRLSIIDLSVAGRQPMSADNGRVHIVYNGEVYNFRDIRNELVKRGHSFVTGTDTEVILKAYLEWGTECLDRFIGMFALALWDGRRKELFVARDRLGKKPLYYYVTPDQFLFASELKALMGFKGFPRNIDPDSIPLFLHYQYIPAPRTVFKNTYKLQPGHYLMYDGHDLRIQPYWSLPDEPPSNGPLKQTEEKCLLELEELLSQAVADRLISDVPLGALLSGGIDSSLVVALMQRANHSRVRTFTIGFREAEYNEAPFASKVAEQLGTEHTELYVSPKEALEAIPHLPEIYDEPFADSSAIPTFLVCRLARSQITVALTGDGGDEQFAGYVRYWTIHSLAAALQRIPYPFRKGLGALLSKIPHTFMESSYKTLEPRLPQRFQVANVGDNWLKFLALWGQRDISEMYRMTICLWSKEDIRRLMGRGLPESQYEESFKDTEGWPLLASLMRVDQRTYLPDAMLTKADRASMAVGLEIRTPLLDQRVVEYTSALPDTLKYRNGTGKYLLKKVLARYLPAELFERPKRGFGVPLDQWFRTGLRDLLLDTLSPQRIKREGLFDERVVEKKVNEHLSGHANHQYRLWPLLIWELWRERWLN